MRDEQSYIPDGQDAPVHPVPVPPKFQAIGIMLTVSGSLNLLSAIGWTFVTLFAGLFTMGIGLLLGAIPIFLAIVGGFELYHGLAHMSSRRGLKPPQGMAVLEICSIVTCSVSSLIAGIIILSFSKDPDVLDYYDYLAE